MEKVVTYAIKNGIDYMGKTYKDQEKSKVNRLNQELEDMNATIKRKARNTVGPHAPFHEYLAEVLRLQNSNSEYQKLLKEYEASAIPKQHKHEDKKESHKYKEQKYDSPYKEDN